MKTTLNETGDLNTLRAILEEGMLEAYIHLESQSQKGSGHSVNTKRCKPAMPPEIILANHLACQYLDLVGLQRTSEVLCAESGLPYVSAIDGELISSFRSMSSFKCRPHLSSIVNKILQQGN